ncbi:unnamed protein product [Pseudo-nitzschia multistriata]|uniref:Uncharacterized protein n=1 Tax=Pseudo-nitzschia multistriata TaxID=183589 RepID=A0A448ZAM6_9STRA|nr:unnamed protein product [Pseudo-nitzschia multistriata]
MNSAIVSQTTAKMADAKRSYPTTPRNGRHHSIDPPDYYDSPSMRSQRRGRSSQSSSQSFILKAFLGCIILCISTTSFLHFHEQASERGDLRIHRGLDRYVMDMPDESLEDMMSARKLQRPRPKAGKPQRKIIKLGTDDDDDTANTNANKQGTDDDDDTANTNANKQGTDDDPSNAIEPKTDDDPETAIRPKMDDDATNAIEPKTDDDPETAIRPKMDDDATNAIEPKTDDDPETAIRSKMDDDATNAIEPKTDDDPETAIRPKMDDDATNAIEPKTDDDPETAIRPKMDDDATNAIEPKTNDDPETTIRPKMVTKTDDDPETAIRSKMDDDATNAIEPKTDDDPETAIQPASAKKKPLMDDDNYEDDNVANTEKEGAGTYPPTKIGKAPKPLIPPTPKPVIIKSSKTLKKSGIEKTPKKTVKLVYATAKPKPTAEPTIAPTTGATTWTTDAPTVNQRPIRKAACLAEKMNDMATMDPERIQKKAVRAQRVRVQRAEEMKQKESSEEKEDESVLIIASVPVDERHVISLWSLLECFSASYNHVIISTAYWAKESMQRIIQEAKSQIPHFQNGSVTIEFNSFDNKKYDAGLWCDVLMGAKGRYKSYGLLNDSIFAIRDFAGMTEPLGKKKEPQNEEAVRMTSLNWHEKGKERGRWFESVYRGFDEKGLEIYMEHSCLPDDSPAFCPKELNKARKKRCITNYFELGMSWEFPNIEQQIQGIFPGTVSEEFRATINKFPTWVCNREFWMDVLLPMGFPAAKVNCETMIGKDLRVEPILDTCQAFLDERFLCDLDFSNAVRLIQYPEMNLKEKEKKAMIKGDANAKVSNL